MTTLERKRSPGGRGNHENEQQEEKKYNIPRLSSQADLHMETYKTEEASTTENTHTTEESKMEATGTLPFLHRAR